MTATAHPRVREELVAHLGHLIAGLREFSYLGGAAYALADVRAWVTDDQGLSFREFILSPRPVRNGTAVNDLGTRPASTPEIPAQN